MFAFLDSPAEIGILVVLVLLLFVGTQLPTMEYARRIEIIGDSITCGYGNEGPNATCPYDVPIRNAATCISSQERVSRT